MLTDIDIEIKGDYSWTTEEQEWHEKYISRFTQLLKASADQSRLNTISIVSFNITYYPEKLRFKIESISHREERFLEHFNEDTKLRQYFYR